jgi:hypothetical protein
MILLNIVETSSDGTYKVLKVIRCDLEREALICGSHVMSRWFWITVLYLILVDGTMEM